MYFTLYRLVFKNIIFLTTVELQDKNYYKSSFTKGTDHRQVVKFFTKHSLSLSPSFLPLLPSLSLSLFTYFSHENRKIQVMKRMKKLQKLGTLRVLGTGNERRTRSKGEIDGADDRDHAGSKETKGKKENGE